MSGCHVDKTKKSISEMLVIKNKRYVLKSKIPEKTEETISIADKIAELSIRFKALESKLEVIERNLLRLLNYR